VDALLAGWSHAVEHGRMWTVFGVLGAMLDHERRDAWLKGAVSIGVTELLAQVIKRKIRRERPAMPGLPPLAATPSRFSFPSAHTASTAAAARAYGPLTPHMPWKTLLGAMGFSRPYLGVHYPSDVLAGATLGTLIGSLGRSRHPRH
jgi:membrane-associated phospholipid phosphatase